MINFYSPSPVPLSDIRQIQAFADFKTPDHSKTPVTTLQIASAYNKSQVAAPQTVVLKATPAYPGITPVYKTTIPSQSNLKSFHTENTIPLNSIVLNPDENIGGNPDAQKYMALAALKINPAASVLIPTTVKFSSLSDTNFLKERKRLSKTLTIPEKT